MSPLRVFSSNQIDVVYRTSHLKNMINAMNLIFYNRVVIYVSYTSISIIHSSNSRGEQKRLYLECPFPHIKTHHNTKQPLMPNTQTITPGYQYVWKLTIPAVGENEGSITPITANFEFTTASIHAGLTSYYLCSGYQES